jgi:hypothetical protein
VSSIGPSFFADQRNETHCAKVRLPKQSVMPFGHLDQFLTPRRFSDRHHQRSAGRQLVGERLRDVAAARSDQDRIVRRFRRPAERPVAFDDLDVRIAEPRQPLARGLDQFRRSIPITRAPMRLITAEA